LLRNIVNVDHLFLDLGAQPFILSFVLRNMGYDVVAFDIEPEPYMEIAEACNVNVVKCDLERDELGVANADCVVFTEVLEHLHYYVPTVLAKIDNALKSGGFLILMTLNITSLFRNENHSDSLTCRVLERALYRGFQ